MISEKDFISWLQGFFAAYPAGSALSSEQWEIIKKKLSEVYPEDMLKVFRSPNTFRVQPDIILPEVPPNSWPWPQTWYIGDPPPGWEKNTITCETKGGSGVDI